MKMAEKMNPEYYSPGGTTFNYNTTGGTDSASGGSGGSGMECLQLRSPPVPFHYLMTEQAKSLQELQNEVGALLEFRDLVIETFPNLRSKMAPSTPASGARRDWEPGVRVRRKLANGTGETTRAKPQPSVQDSGFSTETSCGKDAHSSSASASASASRSRPLEDELWALLDVIQRKGGRLRDEAELLRGELDGRHSPSSENVEESFARAMSAGCLECECADTRRLRKERDELLLRSAELEAQIAAQRVDSPIIPGPAAASSPATPTPLGRLDNVLGTPSRPPVVRTPNSKKFAAILHESNPVELQRHLLTSTVQSEILSERLRRVSDQRTSLLERLERAREDNEDLKFQLEEKTIELEGTKAKVRMLQGKRPQTECDSEVDTRSRDRDRDSMRDMEPLHIPDEESESKITETPRRSRPSKIPLHTAGHKGLAPKPPSGASRGGRDSASVSYRSRSGESPARPPSSHSCRSVASAKSRRDSYISAKKDPQTTPAKKTQVPVRRVSQENKRLQCVPPPPPEREATFECRKSLNYVTRRLSDDASELIVEYLARTDRLQLNHIFSRVPVTPMPTPVKSDFRLAYESPQNLALELSKSILYESIDSKTLKSLSSNADSTGTCDDSLWNGKPQQYFESINYTSSSDEDNSLIPQYV